MPSYKSKLLKKIKKPFVFWLLSFIFFSLITLLVFNHRLTNIFTEYGMPDIDTDGGIWYQWFVIFAQENGILSYNPDLWGYPFGYDFTYFPFFNLIYYIQILILKYVTGFSWQNLIFITNVSSLITYPLSAMSALWLSYYLTKNKWASILTGLIFSFSYYHVHMARGQMSINHIEIIPLYFLSLFYFLHKKNAFSLILSALIFSILFMADAYYAFFSGILSVPIMLFYPMLSVFKKIKQAIIYYIPLFIVLVSINFNYFVTNFYLFNQTAAVATGRASIPRNELVNILFYLTPQKGSFLAEMVPVAGSFIFIIIPLLIVGGVIFLRKNRLYLILLTCLLLAILISSYIPILYPLNELYFRFFGIFRGVARMILPAYLFVGLLAGITISELIKTKYYKKFHKRHTHFLFLFLYVVAILSGLSVDETFYRRGDMAHTAALYEPIRKNNDIKVIAPYPMVQVDVGSRCPQTFQLLAQVIHNKTFACGASPFDSEGKKHYEKITYFDEDTISYLTGKNIDTIFVYKNIEKNEKMINSLLMNDPRIQFIGRFGKYPQPELIYPSSNRAWEFNAYQIKEVVELNKKPPPLFFSTNNNIKVEHTKIAPEKYILTIKNVTSKTELIFNSSYSEKWNLYVGDFSKDHNTLFQFKDEYLYDNQQRHMEFMNKWILDPNRIKKYQDSYTTNADGSISMHATIFFKPQAIYSLGSIITWMSFISLTGFLIMNKLYEKYKK